MPVKSSWDDPFERALLASALLDQPPKAAAARTADALSSAAAQVSGPGALGAASAPSVAPGSAAQTGSAVGKWALVSLVVGAALGVGAARLNAQRAPDKLERSAQVAALYSENNALRSVARREVASLTAPAAPSADVDVNALKRELPPSSLERKALERTPSLSEEVRLIDAARQALHAGRAQRALDTLRDYAHRFPNGVLRREASVLRVEALAAAGDRSSAQAEAGRYLKDNPNDPFAERVERAGVDAGKQKE